MTDYFPKPDAFLEIRFRIRNKQPTIHGLCIGYERKKWRMAAFVDHIVEWLPEFALSYEECKSLNHATALPSIRRAARVVYKTKKFAKRGEFGELFLHAVIRQLHDSLPAISKIYYKSAVNDTVKGFDAVHVVGPPEDMELWLGEAKFYSKINAAIKSVLKELDTHLDGDYLRDEFLLIRGKIDSTWPHSQNLKRLLSPGASLDDVFKRVCLPVLLTYDSPCLTAHDSVTQSYIDAFKKEIRQHYRRFSRGLAAKNLPADVRVHLFLMPLATKADLIRALDTKLRQWQNL